MVARVGSPSIVLQAPVGDGLGWLALESPAEVLQASTPEEVRPLLRAAEAAAAAGRIAAGFVTYEAAPAFDRAFEVHSAAALPLAWFGLFDNARSFEGPLAEDATAASASWQPSISASEYEQGIETIHRHIARGDTYQVNYTLRLAGVVTTDPWHLFIALCRGQEARCCAWVDTGSHIVCSASPELFFRLEEERIWCRPMKGTAARGRTLEEDIRQGRWLEDSAKNHAENVMIVDMVRNDLGRIALPRSVHVSRLCELERYPSLFQLTSTVEARTRAPLEEVFAALFPCASVTGAPKVRAMQIIREIEPGPRGLYTGAIGLIGPGRRARFNVAIRTVTIDQRLGRAEYGTGSGVVWDSVARDEWLECSTKALVLAARLPEFELLETLLWEPGEGFALLDRHLQRLADSAAYFGFVVDRAGWLEILEGAARALPDQPHRIRLLVAKAGDGKAECIPLQREERPWRLAVADRPVDSSDPFLFHKTTHRSVYENHQQCFPEHDDVLLWNEKGELTESTRANLVLVRGEDRLTPPIDSGLLAGTFRAELLASGEIREQVLHLADLGSAERLFLINSVRHWIPVELDATTRPKAETRPLKRA